MFLYTSKFSSNLTHFTEADHDKKEAPDSILINSILSNSMLSNDDLPLTSSGPHSNEILIYCQNFNRMKSSSKMTEISKNILSSSYSVIIGTETSWNESVKSEEVFGSNYNVFRNDRDLHLTQRCSGGGVLIAISVILNSELIVSPKFKEFEHVWVKTHIAGETHIFASVYFPPDQACKSTYEIFFQTAEEIMCNFPPDFKIHMYGDFNQRNVDFIPDSDNNSILLPVIGENETLQLIFEKTASLGLNQINHIKNHLNCYLDLLFTNILEDFCVDKSASPLWKNEVFHTAIEYSLFVHKVQKPNDYYYESTSIQFQKSQLSQYKAKIK